MSEEKKPERLISTNWVKPKFVEPAPGKTRFVTTTSPYAKSKTRLTTETVGRDDDHLNERQKKILAGLKKHREELALKIEKAGGKIYRRTR